MPETWASANARMACLACGESGAHPYFNSVGLPVRVCVRCTATWPGLRTRDGLLAGEGARASEVEECADEILRIGWAFDRTDSRREEIRTLAGRVRLLAAEVLAAEVPTAGAKIEGGR